MAGKIQEVRILPTEEFMLILLGRLMFSEAADMDIRSEISAR